jgi:hypothetical protein
MHNTTKLAGAAGVIWATTNAVLGFSTGQPPALDASGADIAEYLTDGRVVYLAAVAVWGATLPLLFVFAGELLRRTSARGGSVAPSLFHPAVATLVTGTTLSYLLMVPFLFGDGLGGDATEGMLRYAYVLTFVVSMIGNIGGAVLIAAASDVQSPGARTVSRVVAGLVGACSVGGLVNPSVAMIGGLGFLVVAVWSMVVGIGLVRDRASVPHAAMAAA